LEEGLERDLGLGVETVVSKETVVRRKREDDLRRSSDEVSSGLLLLDGTEQSEEVGLEGWNGSRRQQG
jgi:hypothetical protein